MGYHESIVYRFRRIMLSLAVVTATAMCQPAFAVHPEDASEKPASCVHELRYQPFAGLILVSVTIADSPPLDFVLDSGATRSSLTDPLLAAALGLKVKESALARGVGSGATRVMVTETIDVWSDGVEILSTPLVIHDIGPRLEAAAGREIHGFLGAELFERYVVEINPVGHRILLHDPATFTYEGSGHHVPLEVVDKRPIVLGRVVVVEDGKEVPVRLVADTGSSRSLSLITKSARHLKPPAEQTAGSSVGMVGQSRVVFASSKRLQVGPVAVAGVETAWIGSSGVPALKKIPNLNGILGNQFLSRFRVVFDYGRERLIINDVSGLTQIAPGVAE